MNRLFLSTILGLVAAGLAGIAEGASFDCAKAAKPDEIAVCKNAGLSALDSEMGALWFALGKAPSLMGARGAFHDEADEFLRERGACGAEIACLRELYRARIATLKGEIERTMNNVMEEENSSPSETAAGGAGGSTLPAGIEAIVDGYGDQCRELGGALAAGADRPLFMMADFDGDGRQDYVLNPQNMECSAAATAFCGNGGCQISVAVSGKDYQEPITALGGQPTISQASDGTTLEIWVDRTNCNPPDPEKACWATYSWKDGSVTPTYESRSSAD